MKIMMAHNYYQRRGGEDAVFEAESGLLTSSGNVVRKITVSNDVIGSPLDRIRSAWQLPFSRKSLAGFSEQIQEFRPDIVHVHNFFPLLTPAVYDACQAANVPVVQTLHNFRCVCPGALLMRNGKVCELCLERSLLASVVHKCYRDSYLGTLALARMLKYHKDHHTWQMKVDGFITLTQFAKDTFARAGFPEDKLFIKPNFAPAGEISPQPEKSRRALFVGRVSAEKGIGVLSEAWRKLKVPLDVVGNGPLLNDIKRMEIPTVVCLGQLSSEDVRRRMQEALFLVMPSEWFEGFPMVLVEAFACGLPVLASRLGSMAEIVEDGVTGLHFEAGNTQDLITKVEWAVSHPLDMKQMGLNARAVYEQKYTPQKNLNCLLEIYEQLIRRKRRVT